MPDTMLAAQIPALRIADAPPATRFLLRGDAASLVRVFGLSLPLAPCTAAGADDGGAALWLGPDEWLLLVPPGTTLPLWDGDGGAAFDVSHRQVGLIVEGDQAATLLEAACPLDVAAMPEGFCSRTVLGKAEIVLWRRSPASFHLEIWRSFAPYVSALLRQSGRML